MGNVGHFKPTHMFHPSSGTPLDAYDLFAPYSFLSYAQINKEEEIVIHYTFGVVRVKGDHLGKVYSILCNHELCSINCDADRATKPAETRIKEIEFEEIESISA